VLDEANLLLYRRNKSKIIKVFKFLEVNTQVVLLSSQIHKNALDQITQYVSNAVRIFMKKEEQTLEGI